MGVAGGTDIASVEDEPMMSRGNICFGNVAREALLDGIRRCGALRDKPKTMADAEDVGVDSHSGPMPDDSLHDIGCLTPHTWEFDEFFKRVRNLASEAFHHHLRHAHKVGGLGVGVRDAPDIRKDVVGRCRSHGLRSGVGSKQGRGDKVDALICTLC